MKYYIKRNKKEWNRCVEVCPFKRNENKYDFQTEKIGSGACQSCEHHKNNNLIEEYGCDYNVSIYGGRLLWIECDKLNK